MKFDPKKFIEHSYRIEKKDVTSLRCIDDREDRQPAQKDPLPSYAVPGAGLGITLDTMAAVYALADEYKTSGPDAVEVFEAVERVLNGTVSYHTDTIASGDFACAGCGYCAASLIHPEKNFIPEKVVEFVESEALDRCTKELEEKGVEIPKYKGPHVAEAVMIVRGDNVGVPSTAPTGDHAYVYHKDVRDELLKKAADTVYPLLEKIVPVDSLSMEEWREKVILIADKRLDNVLQQLAIGLPRFVVKEEDGAIVVDAV